MKYIVLPVILGISLISIMEVSARGYEKTPLDALSTLSYMVTQESATEQPYQNPYWDNHQEGIYVDTISGSPLFSSLDKYDSDTGWPTFSRPISRFALSYMDDYTNSEKRIEVRSHTSQSHLGHLFDDGPLEYDGVRYCMNSAAMRFIPKSELKGSRYGIYLRLFR